MKILDPKNAKELAKELEVISRIAPDLAPNILAGRYNLINKSVNNLGKIKQFKWF